MKPTSLVWVLALVVVACGPTDVFGPEDAADPGDPDDASVLDDDGSPGGPDGGGPMVDAAADATPCVPSPDGERCNGVDDDCDELIDEGFPAIGIDCDVGVGVCERNGTTICSPDGMSVVCSATPARPRRSCAGPASTRTATA